jgi:small subunit ribosomal protein S2
MKAAEEKQRSFTMAKVDMKALLEAGVHFGHRTQKWNPRMNPYIFTERNGIHIIDLSQTATALENAYDIVSKLVSEGGVVLFVGTKRQAIETIELEAQRVGMPFVTVRWLGGMLTNWQTMRQRINELDRLERMRERGEFDLLTKREALTLTRKIEKLQDRFGGIREINRLPDLIFVVDVKREDTAVREANILGIPVLGMVDTNCDPSLIDHVIPSNDDAIRAIKMLTAYIADAVEEGLAERKDEAPAKDAKGPKKQAGRGKDLTDEELLGAATLKKVAAAQEKEAAAQAVAEAEAEAKAKSDAEEAALTEAAEGEAPADAPAAEETVEVAEEPAEEPAKEDTPEPKAEKEVKKEVKAETPAEGPSTRKKLSSFEIASKTVELLEGAKLSTVNQFLKALEAGDEAVLEINGIGPKGLQDVKDLLKKEGYELPK